MMIITGTSRVKIMVERGNILSQSVHHPLERYSSKKYFDDRVFLSPLVDSNKIILSKHF